MEKILIIEDDRSLKEELSILLKANGFEPVDDMPCDLALLDINLPGKSGFDLCRELRTYSNIPIIFLTARESSNDELIGFGVGADDYIRKPYNSSILLARISRLLKRRNNTTFEKQGLKLNLSEMTVEYSQKVLELTKNEARILACLMQKDLCTKQEIIEYLWNSNLYIDENTLYVNVNRLREKLKNFLPDGFIRTVRGVGYRL